jgi:hypothetical protein
MYPDVYTQGRASVNIDVGKALPRNLNLDAVILDFSKDSTFLPAQTIAAAPDRVQGRNGTQLKRQYRSMKLRFFVWYINAKGDVAAWSKLLPKP